MSPSDIAFAAQVADLNTACNESQRDSHSISTSKPTAAMKKQCITAAALGILLFTSAHATRAAAVDSADVLPANTAQYRSLAGTPGIDARLDTPLSQFLVRLPGAFGNELGLAPDHARQRDLEVLLRNSDALVRATVRMNLGREWLGFVYADMGATDSTVRWQGLAGIHGGSGLDVLGGWRRVTYHFSPGGGLDSLDFDGPFLGATFAW
jgi:hypothetical protein